MVICIINYNASVRAAESLSVEFVCNVLVVADQLLITRLKEICEVVITENREPAMSLPFQVIFCAYNLRISMRP